MISGNTLPGRDAVQNSRVFSQGQTRGGDAAPDPVPYDGERLLLPPGVELYQNNKMAGSGAWDTVLIVL